MATACSCIPKQELNEDTTAKHEDDLKEANRLIEEYPDLKEKFELFDKIADVISKMDNYKEEYQLTDLLGMLAANSKFDFSKPEEKEVLSEYLARINMTKLLYNLYKLLMEKAHTQYLTDSIINKISDEKVICLIRNIFLNFSYGSLFAEYLAETGIFKFYIQDLKAMKKDISEPEKLKDIFLTAIGTIHNCARNPATRHIFHRLEAVTYIIPFLKCDLSRNKIIVLMTLAYTIREDQNHLLMAEKDVYQFLLNYTKKAWESDGHIYDVFSVDSLVSGMKGLAMNEDNKKLLMEAGPLPVLVEILKNGNDAEKILAIECIWQLSFNKENKKIILKDQEVMALLKSVSKSQNENIAKAASGALWVLDSKERERKLEDSVKQNATPEKKPRGHIMHEEGQAGTETTVAQWSDMDVQKWLQENNLTSNASLNKLTGEQLEFLHKLSDKAPEFYFGFLERKLELSSLEDLMKFSHAVERLHLYK